MKILIMQQNAKGAWSISSETWIPLLSFFFVDVASWHFVLLYCWLNEEGVEKFFTDVAQFQHNTDIRISFTRVN